MSDFDDISSAADANRRLAGVLRQVLEGRSVTVTSRGIPVARIVPISSNGGCGGAKRALLARLRAQAVVDVGPWSRGELYEDRQ